MIFFAFLFGFIFLFISIIGIAATITGLPMKAADFAPMTVFLFVFCMILVFVGHNSPTQETVSKVYYSTSLNKIEFSELKKITEIQVESVNPLVFLKNDKKYLVEEVDKDRL